MTFRIIRFYADDKKPSGTLVKRCSLKEAQDHCKDPETSSSTATSAAAKRRTKKYGPWFDGYTKN